MPQVPARPTPGHSQVGAPRASSSTGPVDSLLWPCPGLWLGLRCPLWPGEVPGPGRQRLIAAQWLVWCAWASCPVSWALQLLLAAGGLLSGARFPLPAPASPPQKERRLSLRCGGQRWCDIPGTLPQHVERSLGVSAQSFLHCFTLASAAFNLQVATPGGKTLDFVDVNESNARWVQDFRLKAYASPAKLESIDGARYHALLIPSCPGALADLASSGSLARILQHFCAESKPICAVGHGVAALCCATNEDRSWVFQGYSVTGPSVYELVRAPGFAHLPLIVEDFAKDAGACFSASQPDAVHVVLDRHLVTGQNAGSTVPAVQNLLFLCGSRK
ncbi:Parkinson disease 7 domain-containing protein 1 isoform X1 [Sus scrofa]|uniref:Glutamine amidotransferase-like class 1 domain-containing protein 1 n=2 Tax=Sus scrofa TaxID=9823 RepID=A0A4X1VT09_PIG|nr:Parkinson disease 7 domain-containing protein 1 isoform X1 [Sus scrofa]